MSTRPIGWHSILVTTSDGPGHVRFTMCSLDDGCKFAGSLPGKVTPEGPALGVPILVPATDDY